MAQKSHLQELSEKQTNTTAKSLLKNYSMLQEEGIPPAELAARLRLAMDALFKEMIDAPVKPDAA